MTRYGVQASESRDTNQTKPKDFVYSSEYQSPKLHRVFKGTFRTDADGNATVDIAHGLLYAPMVLAFVKITPDGWTALDNDSIGLFTSSTKVTIKTDYASFPSIETSPFDPNTDYPYKFWVFQDPADLL